ncbi:ABC transporter [Agreia bicolorata]|uniref:ABC transporter n=1 Tax=Agreia bicolorata TaxID=110935 RepID=A0ABR5CGE8_9MICO|nr:ABC transporter [Agreia bicolorata]
MRRLARDPQAIITTTLILIIVAAGFLGPIFLAVDPNQADLRSANALPGTPGHPLGADQSGRDILARLLASAQTSAISGLIGAGVALVVGVTMGLIGGYFGRRTSAVTEWVFNLVMTFPGVLLLIVLTPVTGGDYRFTMLIFGFMLSPTIFRITRNLVMGTKQELFVDAARVSGLSNTRILGRHVLSAVRGPIIVATAFLIGTAIATQAGLAFLGIGSSAVPSFGSMVGEGFTNLTRRPLQFLWPSLVLGILTASLVLLGNALRDALEGLRTVPPRRGRTESPAEPVSMGEEDEAPLLRIRHLAIGYPSTTGEIEEVVHGVDLDVRAGEILGLVGESGSGKTQTAFAVLGLLPPEAVITRGSVQLNGRELLGLSGEELRTYRGKTIAYIPQEPMSNLDPSYRVGSQLVESLRATSTLSNREAKERVLALLARVGIPDPQRVFRMYPFEISGGMAQRVLIAGAVASRPALLIADEPTTALDVTVQAEILDLLRDLQAELGMAVLLVTHNFGVVADLCESMAVMQKGRIVETGKVRQTFAEPQADYTRTLLDSILDEDTVRTDPPVAPRDHKEVAR